MVVKERVLVYEFVSGGGLGPVAAHADLLAQGMAMRDALLADLLRIDGIALSCVASADAPLPPALASGVARVRPETGRNPIDFLACESGYHDRVWAIAPESEGVLAALAEAIGAERWIGCTAQAIGVAASKSATRARLAAHGIAVPDAWRPGDPAPQPGLQWVVKPDDGAGTVDTWRHADFAGARDDLLARLQRAVPSTLESWVDGEPLSLSLLCGDGRAELLGINRQRIASQPDDAVAYLGVDIRAEAVDGARGAALATLAQRIAAALPGLAGYVGVDLVWHPARGPVVIEINPRLTCAYVGLSEALGRNLAGEILAARQMETAEDVAH